MNPPDEFELSLPRLWRPRVIGVEVPGGDIDKFGFACAEWGPGGVVPGDLERGVAYRCVFGFDEKGRGFVELGLDCGCCDEDVFSAVAFVVIVLVPDEVTVAAVVETWAAATSEPGDTAS